MTHQTVLPPHGPGSWPHSLASRATVSRPRPPSPNSQVGVAGPGQRHGRVRVIHRQPHAVPAQRDPHADPPLPPRRRGGMPQRVGDQLRGQQLDRVPGLSVHHRPAANHRNHGVPRQPPTARHVRHPQRHTRQSVVLSHDHHSPASRQSPLTSSVRDREHLGSADARAIAVKRALRADWASHAQRSRRGVGVACPVAVPAGFGPGRDGLPCVEK